MKEHSHHNIFNARALERNPEYKYEFYEKGATRIILEEKLSRPEAFIQLERKSIADQAL